MSRITFLLQYYGLAAEYINSLWNSQPVNADDISDVAAESQAINQPYTAALNTD